LANPNPKPLPESARFKPGQSGNPGGRTKAHAEFVKLMQENAGKAVNRLVTGLAGADLTDSRECAKIILAYAHGKPKQAVELTGEDGGLIGVEVIRRVIIDPSAGD
jgi:hypothetical protein